MAFVLGSNVIFLAGMASVLAAAAPVPSIPAGPVQVPPDGIDGKASTALVVVVDGLNTRRAANHHLLARIRDIAEAAPSPPTVTFGMPIALPATGAQRRWLLPFTVSRMPPDAQLTRYVSMKVGCADWTLAYQLASGPPLTSNWTLKPLPAPARAIGPQGVVALNVSVPGPVPATGLKAGSSEFIEQGSKRTLADGQLALCANPAPCTGDKMTLRPPGGQVWLAPRVDPASGAAPRLWPGKYEGVVSLASEDKPAGEQANLTIYVTHWPWQVLGFLLIALGIAVAWYCTTLLRHWLARAQMLTVPVELRARIDALTETIAVLERAAAPLPGIRNKLRQLDDALSDDHLERNGLPAQLPLPWSMPPASADFDAFRKHLTGLAAWLAALQQIVESGLAGLVERRNVWTQKPHAAFGPDQATVFDNSFKALDQIATRTDLPDPAALTAQIQLHVQTFQDCLAPHTLTGVPRTPLTVEHRTPKQLRMRIALGGLLAWGFIGMVTALAGLHVLIFSNPGFGTPMDLLGCVLWGLGLPAATLLASATTSSIASTLNVPH
jgi:hypothetical protein